MKLSWSKMVICIAGLAACTPEPGTNVGAETEQTSVEGPDVVRCFTQLGSLDSKDVRCRLVTDGPLPVHEATLDIRTSNSGSGAKLTPEEPEQLIYSSNVWTRVEVGVAARLDASNVAGIGGELRVEGKLVVEGERITAESPARVRLPFEVWDVSLVGKDAALSGAALAAYSLSLPRNDGAPSEQSVSVALPDVAVGESKPMLIAAPAATLKGEGLLGGETRAIELEGSGIYLVRPDGLEHHGATSDLPDAFACWAQPGQAGVELHCQSREAGGLYPSIIDVAVQDAGGTSVMRNVFFDYDSDKVTVVGDDVVDLVGVGKPIPVMPLADAGWPYTITLDVRLNGNAGAVVTARDGDVIGFDSDDPFEDAPLHVSTTVAKAEELPPTAPLLASVPFAMWKVTFRAGTGITFDPESIEPYQVPIGAAWNGLKEEETATIQGMLPGVHHPGVVEQTFFLPVGPDTTAVTGKAIMTGGSANSVSFTIAGPGIYVAGADGLAPAAP
jgi:hypothetical protein